MLHLDALPRDTTKGTILRLLVQVGGMDKVKVGKIEIAGRSATVEVPATWLPRLVRLLDGTPLGGSHLRASSKPGTVGPVTHDDHFGRLLSLIQLEAKAEAVQALAAMKRTSAADAERSGTSLVGLAIVEEYSGLGGRMLITLSRRDPLQPLPFTRLNIGSPVLLSELNARDDSNSLRAIVSNRDRTLIQIAAERPVESEQARPMYRLDLASDEIGRQRQQAALQRARTASGERLAQLREVLLGEVEPAFTDETTRRVRRPAKAIDRPANMNASQLAAIEHALAAEDVAIIHGPPGTGKTTTVVELIHQAVARGEKVLACAPSNLAVDNLFDRLLARGAKAVRLGHPARVLPSLRAHTLDLMVDAHPDVRLARKLAKQADALRDRASRHTRSKPAPGQKRDMRNEAKSLAADARRLEAQVVAQILDEATVLCSTLTGIDSELLGQRQFDLTVIDEACQSTEPGCWIPLLRSGRLVLAGDHQQLPPTIVSDEARLGGLGVSLQQRLVDRFGDAISRQLTVQYRMHQAIMEFSSREFYAGTLVAHESVATHLLCELPGVESNDLTSRPLTFIDTAGAGYDEEQEPDGESRLNPQEAALLVKKAEELLAAGVPPLDLALIAPYAAQVRHLRTLLDVPGLEIDTVDGFQGREKEAILISLVRSNASGEVGFLADTRRMNVALTRARRKLLVLGDSATIGSHPFYLRLLEYFEQTGSYGTVWEE